MSDWLIIPILALSLPVLIVPFVLGFRHDRRVRELEHIERMRAYELGLTHPNDRPGRNAGKLAFFMGVVVPLVLFSIAAASGRHGDEEIVWCTAAVIGVVSVISGSKLAQKHCGSAELPALTSQKNGVHDPDAFDVVGRRG